MIIQSLQINLCLNFLTPETVKNIIQATSFLCVDLYFIQVIFQLLCVSESTRELYNNSQATLCPNTTHQNLLGKGHRCLLEVLRMILMPTKKN